MDMNGYYRERSWACSGKQSILLPSSTIFRVPYHLMTFPNSLTKDNFESIAVLFVETPRKFITAKLSVRKPGSSSVLIISDRKLCRSKALQ